MKKIILLFVTASFFIECKAYDPDYDRFKIGVNVSLQNVINYHSDSRWMDIHYHKISFFGIGINASQRIKNFDFFFSINVHEETLDNFSDEIVRAPHFSTFRTSHLSVPLGVDIKLSKLNERYLFVRFSYIPDYVFSAEKITGINKVTDDSFVFYRDYLEFGAGYNTMVNSNYGFRAMLSYYTLPIRQNEIFGENVVFSKFGITVGAYKTFQ